jgi:hypothetical protein
MADRCDFCKDLGSDACEIIKRQFEVFVLDVFEAPFFERLCGSADRLSSVTS